MKIILQFDSKSKGKGVSEAVQIAKKQKGKLDGNFYRLEFYSFDDKNLLRLKNLVGRLKQTKIFVDGKETTPVRSSSDSKKKPIKKAPLPKTKVKWLQEQEIFKTNKVITLQNKIRDLYDKSKSFQKEGNYKKAIDSYIEVLRFDHTEGYYFCESLLDIGRLYYLQNQFQETYEVFDRFFGLYPDWNKDDGSDEIFLESCQKIGNTQKVKEIQEKIKSRSKASKDSDTTAKSTDKKRISDYNLENIEEATECLEQALNSDITNFDFWVNLGQVFKNFGQELDDNIYFEKAIECYMKCIEIQPNSYDVLLNIGSLYEHMGNWDDAFEFFKAIMDVGDIEQIEYHEQEVILNPKAVKSWIAMGDILSAYEIYSKAIECYEKALEIDSQNISVWISIGRTYLDSEEVQKALECFRKASKINPERKDIKYIINKIRNNRLDDVYDKLESIL